MQQQQTQTIDIRLIDGVFPRQDAIDILTDMVRLKIRYHERQIEQSEDIEDIRHREARIQRLQEELRNIRERILQSDGMVGLHSNLQMEHWG